MGDNKSTWRGWCHCFVIAYSLPNFSDRHTAPSGTGMAKRLEKNLVHKRIESFTLIFQSTIPLSNMGIYVSLDTECACFTHGQTIFSMPSETYPQKKHNIRVTLKLYKSQVISTIASLVPCSLMRHSDASLWPLQWGLGPYRHC